MLQRALSKHGTLRGTPIPTEIRRWWKALLAGPTRRFGEAALDGNVRWAAWNLFIASDVASIGIGIESSTADAFLTACEGFLRINQYRSFCYQIPAEKLAVLGKQHTPQRGCTLRSLSHNLALYAPADIQAYWHGPFPPAPGQQDVVNLLLLPWPTVVEPGDFDVVQTTKGAPTPGPHPAHRYFEYKPRSTLTPRAVAARVSKALEKAKGHANRIHAIVFPEVSLTPEQFLAVERIAIANQAMLISGVRVHGTRGSNGRNLSVFQPVGITTAARTTLRGGAAQIAKTRLLQHKHHRWCLDTGQIMQYGLGGRLPASFECWERIKLVNRRIDFVALHEWLTVCTLICEDLARQDPVADVIRAVGPNLVVALLMDGPQLGFRWPARYASVLADDPGSSVLTITNLGMARLSRAREIERRREDKSRVIAFWRDALNGEQQIELDPGHDACVLSLVCQSRREYTLDGRGEDQSHFPVFAGTHSFCTTSK